MFGPLYGTLGPLGATWRKLVASGSTLLNGLVSYWPLDERSGTRYDAVGTNHLTDNNTVGAALRGPEGTVASFVGASSEELTYNGAIPPTPSAFTVNIWFKLNPAVADGWQAILIHGNYLGLTGYAVGGRIAYASLTAYDGASYYSYGTGWAPLGVSDGSGWMMLSGVWDGTTAQFYINGETQPSWGGAGGLPVWVPYGGRVMTVGSSLGAQFITGQAARHGLWGAALTQEDLRALFAEGEGLGYTDLSAGQKSALIAWHELDEVSGVRYDSHGSNDLTDNNTVDCEYQGPLGVVASTVEANSEYFSSTSADFTPAGSFSASLWVYITSSDVCFFMGKEFTDPSSEWSILTGAAGGLEGRFWGGGLTQAGGPAGWGARPGNWSAPNLNKWWLLTYVYDATAHTVTMYLNDAAGAPASTGVRTLSELGQPFTILGGARAAYGTNKAASAGFWTKALSGAEVAELFNNGAGLRYADLSDGLKTSLVSYWNLDEQSGVRYDSHGSNDLTDNNTVGSVINAGGAMDGAAASFVGGNAESLTRASLDLGGTQWTSSFWWKPTITPNVTQLWRLVNTWADKCIVFRQFAHPTVVYGDVVFGWGPAYVTSPVQFYPTPDQWHHVIMEGNGTALTITLDGVLLCSATSAAAPNWTTGAFGINYSDGGVTCDAAIDEVAIWSRVLTADERAELYAAGRGKFYDFTEA